MTKTATEVLTGTFGKLGLYHVAGDIPPDEASAALARLNDYLNGLNGRGAVFPTVSLALTDTVPVTDQNLGDLEWALADEMSSQWGKEWTPAKQTQARQAAARFIAAYLKVYPATPDAGLKTFPSTRRTF
jgi:hypothetical protein